MKQLTAPPSYGTMRNKRQPKALKPVQAMHETPTPQEDAARQDQQLDSWSKQVGDTRARVAMEQLRKTKRLGATLPELLAEAWLTSRGDDYRTQVDIGFSKPDIVRMGVEGGCHVWRIQGDYWHNRPGVPSSDEQKKQQMLGTTIYGQPVMAVIDIWESRIYQGDEVFEQAMLKQEVVP